VIGVQPEHDLAVLKASKLPDDLKAAVLRSTQDLAPGDEVVAVGFPFGIGPSASAGIISGLKREYRSPEGKRLLTNLIQFDAAANPGNSGGPARHDGRRGRRHRHGDPQPDRPARVRRHRLRGADRERRVRRRDESVLTARCDARSCRPPTAHRRSSSASHKERMDPHSLVPSNHAPLPERILYEVKKVVVGQDAFLERVLVAILAQGHLLVEGVPGLAKTLTVKTLARTIRGHVQAHPVHARPRARRPRSARASTTRSPASSRPRSGPVFTNLLLADEINRAPAKVQSALLEVMQERQVTIAGDTHRVPDPFLVMATQNPIETEGTYPLPEAQVDRFMMKVLVGYPSETEEFVIVERVTGSSQDVLPVATTDQLAALYRECRSGYVDPALMQYAVRLVAATRDPERHGVKDIARYITFGASPRATIGPRRGARALAFLRGRAYALPEDLIDIAPRRASPPAVAVVRGARRRRHGRRADPRDPALDRRAGKAAGDPCRPHRAKPETLLRKLEWTVLRRLDGLLQGDYRTLFRGLRPGPRGPARVPVPRRRPAHRLERHGAPADAVRARVHRGPRGQRVVPARPLGVGRLRQLGEAQARGLAGFRHGPRAAP
jgi:MoxR-like ATPase